MFPTLNLLRTVSCPDPACTRNCLYSHQSPSTPSARASTAASSVKARASNGQPPAKRPRVEAAGGRNEVGARDAAPRKRSAGPPRLETAYGSHTPLALRNDILRLFYNAFFDCYVHLPGRRDLAYDHAYQQEKAIYHATKTHSYKAVAAQALTKIKKRETPARLTSPGVGLNEELERRQAQEKEVAARPPDPRLRPLEARSLQPYTLAMAPPKATQDYIWAVPAGVGGSETDQVGKTRDCDRCKKPFLVKEILSEHDKVACHYHWGRMRTDREAGGPPRRAFSCCGSVAPCAVGPHVFVDKDPHSLHARRAFVSTDTSANATATAAGVLAIDCELIYTVAGLSLARVTAVAPGLVDAVLDEYVRPPGAVLDCNTRFSGITTADLESNAVLDLGGIQRALGAFIGPETILVGHGFENDLKALRLIHPVHRIVDTAILYPHPAGFPIRHSLRNLVKAYLGTFIQDEGTHDSSIDARATLDLVHLKVDANGGDPRRLV